MHPGDIVFDIETKKSFDEVSLPRLGKAGGQNNFHLLGVSVLGAYVYGENKYLTFEEHELPEFEKLLKSAGRVIGFNIHHFDLPVLQPYISWNLKNLSTLDLMDDVKRSLGHRLYLDSLADATLGIRKSGDGLQALKWYKEGKIDEIKKYCLKDVEITKNLYEFGRQQGHVLFYSRDTGGRVAIPVHWNVSKESAMSSPKEIINEGLQTRHSVSIEYSAKEKLRGETPKSSRVVDVYKIFNDSFEGYCHLRQGRRIFKIGNVLSACLTNNTYKLAEDVQNTLI